ncbi:hypothetical protein Ciccas_013866, partial [Cichlidogyrus casuarinus]
MKLNNTSSKRGATSSYSAMDDLLMWFELGLIALSIVGLFVNGAAIYAIYKIVRPTRGLLAFKSSLLSSHSTYSFNQSLKTRSIKALSDMSPSCSSNRDTDLGLDTSRRFSEFPFSRKQSQAWNKASGKGITSKRRITPNLRYVWALAIIDFLHSLLIFFQMTLSLLSIPYINLDCLYLITNCLLNAFHSLILLVLSMIALDLYFGIVHWRWYNHIFMPNSSTFVVLAIILVVSLLVGFSQAILPPIRTRPSKSEDFCHQQLSANYFQGKHVTFGVLIFATVIITIAYAISIFYARKLHRSAASSKMNAQQSKGKRILSSITGLTGMSNKSTTEEKFQDKYIRGLATTGILVICFLISFMPSFVVELLTRMNKDKGGIAMRRIRSILPY